MEQEGLVEKDLPSFFPAALDNASQVRLGTNWYN